jgi:hypothetical protein
MPDCRVGVCARACVEQGAKCAGARTGASVTHGASRTCAHAPTDSTPPPPSPRIHDDTHAPPPAAAERTWPRRQRPPRRASCACPLPTRASCACAPCDPPPPRLRVCVVGWWVWASDGDAQAWVGWGAAGRAAVQRRHHTPHMLLRTDVRAHRRARTPTHAQRSPPKHTHRPPPTRPGQTRRRRRQQAQTGLARRRRCRSPAPRGATAPPAAATQCRTRGVGARGAHASGRGDTRVPGACSRAVQVTVSRAVLLHDCTARAC